MSEEDRTLIDLSTRLADLENRERPITDIGARVFHSVNQSIPNGGVSLTPLVFDSERYDSANLHSTVANTGRLTVPVAGRYLVWAGVRWAGASSGERQLGLRAGGTVTIAYLSQLPVGTSPTDMIVSTIWSFAAGQYVEVVVYQTSGGTLNIVATSANSAEFAIQRLQ